MEDTTKAYRTKKLPDLNEPLEPTTKNPKKQKQKFKKEETSPFEYITTKIKVSGTVTLIEPTENETGLGLFLLEDGTVRWSVVTLKNGEDQ